jgi:hypothetical protein
MTLNQREQLRLSLLRFLEENPTRYGLPAVLLWQFARAEGRPKLTEETLAVETQYLEDKGLILSVVKTISPENRAWRITAAGRDYLAEVAS